MFSPIWQVSKVPSVVIALPLWCCRLSDYSYSTPAIAQARLHCSLCGLHHPSLVSSILCNKMFILFAPYLSVNAALFLQTLLKTTRMREIEVTESSHLFHSNHDVQLVLILQVQGLRLARLWSFVCNIRERKETLLVSWDDIFRLHRWTSAMISQFNLYRRYNFVMTLSSLENNDRTFRGVIVSYFIASSRGWATQPHGDSLSVNAGMTRRSAAPTSHQPCKKEMQRATSKRHVDPLFHLPCS